MIIKNTGSITDTFDISVKSNDGGFTITIEDTYESVVIESGKRKPVIINVKTSESSEGVLYAFMEISSRGDRVQTADVKLTVDTDHDFGNKTSFGNSVDVHYAGILASNSKLFDSSMEYIWDNYMHRKEGVTEQNRHTATLNANNIGCDGEGYPTVDCEGGRGMIKGFDTKMVGMYEGQTLSVRIPAKDAYGEAGASSSDLAGEDLIFTIEMVKIN
jgi:FKBP-type peptidyl-prolyl cis-trans isomerase